MNTKRSTFIPVEQKPDHDPSTQLRAVVAAAVHWYAGRLLASAEREGIFS